MRLPAFRHSAIAADWLRRGELDTAIVGAVDFAGDVRAVIARHRLFGGTSGASCACDGAVAIVLKRLEDAQRDGDRVYAILGEVATSSGTHASYLPINSCEEIESIQTDFGHAGAATGLATVAKGALCLSRRIMPTGGMQSEPGFWMRNRAEGPRRARMSVASLGGVHGHVELEEFGDSGDDRARGQCFSPKSVRTLCRSKPTTSRNLALESHELSDDGP